MVYRYLDLQRHFLKGVIYNLRINKANVSILMSVKSKNLLISSPGQNSLRNFKACLDLDPFQTTASYRVLAI
jgi:hypothetical protein